MPPNRIEVKITADTRKFTEAIKVLRMVLAAGVSKADLAALLAVEQFKVRMRACNTTITDDQLNQLIDESVRAAHETTAVNWVFIEEALRRLEAMACRGDTFDQMLDWCQALPDEVYGMIVVEEIKQESIYPGGPGRIYALFAPMYLKMKYPLG